MYTVENLPPIPGVDPVTRAIFPGPFMPAAVHQLIVNSDGSVLGATPLGVVGWKEGKQQALTVRNGLPCDVVYARNIKRRPHCGKVRLSRSPLTERSAVMKQEKYIGYVESQIADIGLNRFAVRIRSTFSS